MRANFSPARNVRSTTAPVSMFLTLVRTNAPPLPGFTCWNSTIRQTPPSSEMCIPFRNWLVLTVSATAVESSARQGLSPATARGCPHGLRELHELLGEGRQDLRRAVADDDQVLDADPAAAREVDAGLHARDVGRLERLRRLGREPRQLVHVHADAVAQVVAEVLAQAC